MDARQIEQHEHVAKDLDRADHRYVPPAPSSAGHFRALTLLVESPDSVRAAREMTRASLQDWGLGHVVEDARLVVSELVGNVVHHAVPDDCLSQPGAARRVDVLLKAWPGWLFIGVADEDSTSPDLPVADFVFPDLAGDFVEAVLPDSGRGLFIVQRLADALWCSPKEGGGKIVWCRFDLEPERVDGPPSAIRA